jgi:hemerythrin
LHLFTARDSNGSNSTYDQTFSFKTYGQVQQKTLKNMVMAITQRLKTWSEKHFSNTTNVMQSSGILAT